MSVTIKAEINLSEPKFDYREWLRDLSNNELDSHYKMMSAARSRHKGVSDIMYNAATRDLEIIMAEIEKRGL